MTDSMDELLSVAGCPDHASSPIVDLLGCDRSAHHALCLTLRTGDEFIDLYEPGVGAAAGVSAGHPNRPSHIARVAA
jgi:hypothetical protein